MMKKQLIAACGAAAAGLFASGSKRRYYAAFTALFMLTALLVLSWFLFTGRSLIYESDGWSQYYKAHVYYGRYLRQILRTLFSEGRLVLPAWDPAIGEGADVLGTLHYYVMGDPIALLTVLIPSRFMHLWYGFSILLRLSLAGLSFSVLCFGMKLENRFGILTGALAYSFSAWAVRNVARHIVFLPPLITLPLIILGIEKILRKERPYLYAAAIALAAVTNFYFFYMIAVMVVIYALCRLLPEGRRDGFGTMIRRLFLLLGYSLLGASIAGVVLLPALRTFLQDSRMTIDYAERLFYPRNYYVTLPYVLLTAWNTGNYLCIGLTAPAFFACVRLWGRRGEGKLLKRLLAVCAVLILLPACGKLMNGFSYAANRWCFGLAMLASFILASGWEGLFEADRRQKRRLTGAVAALFAICLLFEKSRTMTSFVMLGLMLFAVSLPGSGPKKELRQALLCLLTVFSIAIMSMFLYSPAERDLVSMSVDREGIPETLTSNEAAEVKKLAKEVFPRYTGRKLEENINMIAGISSTQYYWSLSNPAVSAFRADLEMREIQYQKYEGYDDRTALITLSGTQYYAAAEGDTAGLPYGFKKVKTVDLHRKLTADSLKALKAELGEADLSEAQEQRIRNAAEQKITIYRNKYALPFGFCYDAVIDGEQWRQMNAVQKQQAMLTAAYVEGERAKEAAAMINGQSGKERDGQNAEASAALTADYSIPFEVRVKSGGVTFRDGRFAVTGSKGTASLAFEGPEDAEIYVELKGFAYTSACRYDLYFGDPAADPEDLYNRADWDLLSKEEQTDIRREKRLWSEKEDVSPEFKSSAGTVKKLYFLTDGALYTSGRRDFIINLGCAKEKQTGVTITFPARGIYEVEELKIYAVPLEEYRRAIPALRQSALEHVETGVDVMQGSVSADQPKLMVLTIPYSEGWKAFLDGAEVPVLTANGRYLGLVIPAGEHRVELRYHTPWLTAGALVSLAGILTFAGMALLRKGRGQKSRTGIKTRKS